MIMVTSEREPQSGPQRQRAGPRRELEEAWALLGGFRSGSRVLESVEKALVGL